MDDPASLPLWPDTVTAFYADRACSIRSAATRKTWGYTYRWLQRLHPDKPLSGFRTDDLVAFVTQRDWDGPRWASATARNYLIALQSLFGWAHHAERIPIDPAWRLGQLVPIRRVRVWQPRLTEHQIAALLRTVIGADLTSRRDRTLLMLGLFAGLRTGELHRLCWRDITTDCGSVEIVGKGARPATAVVPPQLRDQLRTWPATVEAEDDFRRDWPILARLDAPGGDTVSVVLGRPPRPLSIEGIPSGRQRTRQPDRRRLPATSRPSTHLGGHPRRPRRPAAGHSGRAPPRDTHGDAELSRRQPTASPRAAPRFHDRPLTLGGGSRS
jgi:integrase